MYGRKQNCKIWNLVGEGCINNWSRLRSGYMYSGNVQNRKLDIVLGGYMRGYMRVVSKSHMVRCASCGYKYDGILNKVCPSCKGPFIEEKNEKTVGKTRSEILEQAKICVCGHRENEYGSPEDNFKTIANLWSSYKDVEFTATDVAMMMALLKIARVKGGNATKDSFVDLAGYAACGGEISLKLEKENENNEKH